MGEQLDDLEFWLPSEFLTDDDLLTDFRADRFEARRSEDFSNGLGNSFGFGSDLSSPVESVETESDEDDFITELSRKVAHSTLQDSVLFTVSKIKGLKLSGSPQSTLCGYKSVSNGNPTSVSRVSSSPDAKDALRWDLLYAAAGEVARMRMMEETVPFYSMEPFSASPKPNRVNVSQQNRPASGFCSPNHAQIEANLSYHQLQAAHLHGMKQQQMMKSGVLGQGIRNGGGGTHVLSMSALHARQQSQLQRQQPGSGMRALFIGETGPKKERIGTGVFMPRRFGSNNSSTETRKKPGCSTVLIPDRVVHALNLNLGSLNAQGQPRGNGCYDADLKQSSNVLMPQQRSFRPHPVSSQELRLPQEWTY